MASEKKIEVKVYKIYLHCDCGGEMLPTGAALSYYPPVYPHMCQKCGHIENINSIVYPYLKYEEVKS
jgi:hypothetical protein